MGLLEKSLRLSQQGALSFFEFSKKYNLNCSAILSKFQNNFIITNSVGIDGDSILSSVSTQDFWDGTVSQKNKLYTFDEANLMRPFLQLFSDNLVHKIKSISIYYTDEKILIVLGEDADNKDFGDSLISDFNLLVNETSKTPAILNFTKGSDEFIRLFRLSLEKNVEAYINKKVQVNEHKAILTSAINQAIYNKLKTHFSAPDYIFKYNTCSFNLVTVSKTNIPYELMKKHLEVSLKEMLSFYAETLDLSDYGQANSYQELIEFIQAR